MNSVPENDSVPRRAGLTSRGARLAIEVGIVAWAISFDLLGIGTDIRLDNGTNLPWAGVVVVVGTYLPLFLRWRHPIAVLALQCLMMVGLSAVSDDLLLNGVLIATQSAARRLDSGRSTVALAFALASALLAVAFQPGRHILAMVMTVLIVGLYVWGRTSRANARQARQRQLDQAAQYEQQAIERRAAERRQLARDLHDIVSHSVSAMLLQAAGARAMMSNSANGEIPGVQSALTSIESAGVQAMRELHRLLGLLREEGEQGTDDIEGSSLQYLDALVETTRMSGVDVRFSVEGQPMTLDASVDLAAFRVVQESLANAMKHAGPGSSASVRLIWQPTQLDIRVRSQPGFRSTQTRTAASGLGSGYGLRGLGERVELLGGTFEYGPVEGGTFLTWATIPLTDSRPSLEHARTPGRRA